MYSFDIYFKCNKTYTNRCHSRLLSLLSEMPLWNEWVLPEGLRGNFASALCVSPVPSPALCRKSHSGCKHGKKIQEKSPLVVLHLCICGHKDQVQCPELPISPLKEAVPTDFSLQKCLWAWTLPHGTACQFGVGTAGRDLIDMKLDGLILDRWHL